MDETAISIFRSFEKRNTRKPPYFGLTHVLKLWVVHTTLVHTNTQSTPYQVAEDMAAEAVVIVSRLAPLAEDVVVAIMVAAIMVAAIMVAATRVAATRVAAIRWR